MGSGDLTPTGRCIRGPIFDLVEREVAWARRGLRVS